MEGQILVSAVGMTQSLPKHTGQDITQQMEGENDLNIYKDVIYLPFNWNAIELIKVNGDALSHYWQHSIS